MSGFPKLTKEEMTAKIQGYFDYLTNERPDTANSIFSPKLIDCDPESFSLTVLFPITDNMKNSAGIAHGGIIAMAYDITMGTLAKLYQDGRMSPTLDMGFTFIKPVPAGESIIITVHTVVTAKHTIDFECSAVLQSAPETTVNTAHGKFFIY